MTSSSCASGLTKLLPLNNPRGSTIAPNRDRERDDDDDDDGTVPEANLALLQRVRLDAINNLANSSTLYG